MPAFKVDENQPSEVLDLLRGARHDASSVKEEGLCGAPDDVVARVCRDEPRTLVTLDLGFGDVRRNLPPLICDVGHRAQSCSSTKLLNPPSR